MEQSMSQFAKEALSNLKNSFLNSRRYYAQMDQESENEEDITMSHSLFYSIYDNNADSIPLTLSNPYSDRSELLFEHEDSSHTNNQDVDDDDDDDDDDDESPKPSAIYLDQPTTFNHFPKALSESLLPTSTAIPLGIKPLSTKMKDSRKYRDPIFAALYTLCLAIFLLSSFIVLFTTNSRDIEDYIKGSTFKTIKDSAGVLSVIIITALMIGTFWLYILRIFTKTFVWGTVVCVPISLTTIFIWTLVESLQNYYIYEGEKEVSITTKDTGLTIMSFIPLILNLIYIKLIFDYRHRINKTISIIELSCDVIKYNPGVILVSFLLVIIFVIFSIIWIILFTRLWLIGHLSDKSSLSGPVWIVNNYVYSLAAFYIFIYMWTARLLMYMERFILSAITAQWYFHRQEPMNNKPWKIAFVRATSTSFGTLALASLILAIIQFLQLVASLMRKYSKTSRPFANVLSFILRYIDILVSAFSNYTISLTGITGEGFFAAAQSATKIFRRNLLTGVFGDLLTQLMLYIGASIIALTSGFSAYVYATHNLHSPHGFIVGLIGTLIPWYMSQFFSYIMISIIDATFLCYAIDLDAGTVHLSAAHTAFSGFD
ncbi:plasma-membrane choline transporter-domain-containing protein [Cokeromyces recurvatus]|uniref:plasma-membrane choline transporter-domain-containing protein n=1 Tax=Cokeromyces recurvatus TaxID=90255 RepID=UPI00221F58A7|nr:plasma-membrane choline transporter-domain-containing protein [Cokeromyces recurvatus]KAI7902769.1 plasma-membrane choline transporter-domain-containing protein [Cokeromyces recurvatus]